MICTTIDDFIEEKNEAYWIAELSDGTIVYQDDGRPGLSEFYAWLRLKSYCETNNLFIKEIKIRFRFNTQFVYKNEGDGFFWRLKALSNLAFKKSMKYQLFGLIKDNQIHVKHVRVPELLFEEDDVRDIEGCEETIIWNKKK